MTVLKYNTCSGSRVPLASVGTLLHELISPLSEASPASTTSERKFEAGWAPSLDLFESGEGYTLQFQVPGFSKEELSISYHEGVLTVSGKKSSLEGASQPQQPQQAQQAQQAQPSRPRYYIRECHSGQFSRSVTVPSLVKISDISASVKDGILTILLPKAEEAKPLQINVL